MTKSDQIKILNDKNKANNAKYKIDRLNAEISAFSEGDLDKYEFLTRKDLKYKPNALDKAKFEFSPLRKAFNQGLDKKAENYKEEGVIKLLKYIRDRMVRPNVGKNDGNGNNDDNGDDNDNNDDNDEDLLEVEELEKRFNKLRNKNILEAEKLERKFENLKNRKIIKERIDALKKN